MRESIGSSTLWLSAGDGAAAATGAFDGGAAAGDAGQSRLELGLRGGPDGERDALSGADVVGRAHAGMLSHARELVHPVGERDHGDDSGDGTLQCAGAFTQQQWAGVHRGCDSGLAARQEREDDLHHAECVVGERLHRKLPRPTAWRMFEPGDFGRLWAARVVIGPWASTRTRRDRKARWAIRRPASFAGAASAVRDSGRATPSLRPELPHQTSNQWQDSPYKVSTIRDQVSLKT
ncbi:MAG: hypothetical protein BWX84_01852 [Verrucomicrobia bacterium ADurb.Bin118]|nr:MAG: hypothetical protein BWX84_01852 [Verrucomicrobia bacterium ADurb.Bin118]